MNRNRKPFDSNLAKRIATEYFSTPREPGEPFWSIREIAAKFGVTQYSAGLAIVSLEKSGILESSTRRGTFVSQHPQLSLSQMEHVGMSPAFVWPRWGHDDRHGSLCEDVVAGLVREGRKHQLQLTFFDSEQTWTDSTFPVRLRASDSNVLIAMDPPLEALVAMIELRQAGVPVVVLGSITTVHERFGIVAVNTDDRETACNLTHQLRHKKFSRLLVIGVTDEHNQQQRAAGIEEALIRYDGAMPLDVFLDSPEISHRIGSLQERLRSKKHPDALIFYNHCEFLRAMQAIPELGSILKNDVHAAIFDDGHLDVHYPELPITRVVAVADDFVRKAMELTGRMLRDLPVPSHTWLKRQILTPSR